jgi:hypothetical protein
MGNPRSDNSAYCSEGKLCIHYLRVVVLAFFLSAGAIPAFGQSVRTEHTFGLDDPENRPPATLNDVSWFAGSWTGEAFGGTFEEVWNQPSEGSMVGMFKLMDDEGVSFYELMLFVEEEGSLSFKVRHFNPDFTAWEGKEEVPVLPFIKADENSIHFEGISFYRISDDETHAYLVFHKGDELIERKLIYRRQAGPTAATP